MIDRIVRFLGSTETSAPYAKEYMTYILIAAPAMTGGYTLNNLLRYDGKPALGMVGLIPAAILNIALYSILMFALDLGIAGAAMATAFSQVVSFLILLSMFAGENNPPAVPAENGPGNPLRAEYRVHRGLPSMLRQVLNSVATILLNSQASLYGDEAVAAMSIVSRITFFAFALAPREYARDSIR